MKHLRLLSILSVAALLSGCGLELLGATAVHSDLQAQQLKAINGQVANASKTSALVQIQRAIDTFKAEQGRNPSSLAEIAPAFIPSVPNRPDGQPYAYDAVNGKVLDAAAPSPAAGPTAGDLEKLAKIQDAINSYGTTVGYYPPSLQALVPTYLPELPKTDSGQDFVFDPQTGFLGHPGAIMRAPAAQAQRSPNGVAGGGSGPMGEAMTGIAVQNQLNNMGSSATNSAGGYARGSVDGTVNQHNQQQEQAMDQLGL
jgi:hypothetical protein